MRLTSLAAWLDRETSPRAVGVMRIAIGLVAALQALEVGPVLLRLSEPGIVRLPYAALAEVPSITNLPAPLIVGAWLLLALAFAVGAFTTAAGISLAMLLAAVLAADQQLYSNHLYLLTILVGLLTLARAGAAVSISAARGHGRSMLPAWPIWLIRAQVSIVYLFAGLAKINAPYLSGSVLASTLRRDGPLAIPDAWRGFELMMVLSLVAILVELGLAVGLWLPRWRGASFAMGLGLHLAIAAWLAPTEQLVVFGLLMLPTYLVFGNVGAPMLVIWDDACTFCTGTVDWLRRLDWLRVLTFAPGSDAAVLERHAISRADADRAVQLVGPDGRSAGYMAMVRIFERLPATFLVAPLLRLPPVAWVGARVYRRVAERRSCRVSLPAEEPSPAHAGEQA